jgi:hypothetical protein
VTTDAYAPTETDPAGLPEADTTGTGTDSAEQLETALADLPTFADLGVQAPIVQALAGVGITHPFPIQAMTLPVALTGHDIIGQAKTGTGKTLGFGIPLLQRVVAPGEEGFDALEAPGKPQALVVVPTRELAASPSAPSTATWARVPGSRRCAPSGRARSTCSWRPTSPPAGSTSTT